MWEKALYKLKPLYDMYSGAALSITSRYPLGTHVFDREWDVLILLDTCRVDALKQVAPEYDFINEVTRMTSIGSTSSEWIAQTFSREFRDEIGGTAYVSGNGWAEKILEDRVTPENHADALFSFAKWDIVDHEDLLVLDQAWRYEPDPRFDHGLGHPKPKYVTDRAISIAREYRPNRLIVHYSQPHSPFTARAIREERELKEHEKTPFEYLRNGGDRKIVWNAYLDNLRYVLDDVEVLLTNIDAETVAISADHGEAFGEYGIYGHGPALPHPQVKFVPWAVTSATDEGNYDEFIESGEKNTSSVDNQLEALGYKI
ncbi:alkaline phosphatase family protein [Halopenitus persicus]|uniref:Sulfatase n=1 Tax=Halopenitus persicus TaxID=1048396 RepID=A0A1H3MDJ7_9EURY|nr:hypothetical protein [Halopenitus persicus]SDY74802.1 hypothetical protein SAMN05216564_10957 [Halopenitus persicus]